MILNSFLRVNCQCAINKLGLLALSAGLCVVWSILCVLHKFSYLGPFHLFCGLSLCFVVFPYLSLVVGTSASVWLEKLISEMIY